MSSAISARRRHGQRYTLSMNVYDYQIACTSLQQKSIGEKLSVRYWSRSLFVPEKNYSTTENKRLTLVRSILTLRPYFYEETCTLRTDYHALKGTFRLAVSSEQVERWRLRLPKYDYKVEHRPGATHKVAKEVFRLRRSEKRQDTVDGKVYCFVWEGIPREDAA